MSQAACSLKHGKRIHAGFTVETAKMKNQISEILHSPVGWISPNAFENDGYPVLGSHFRTEKFFCPFSL